MTERKPNSLECAFGGYELSSIIPEVQVRASERVEVVTIGCEEDDTFYADSGKQGRVEIQVVTENATVSIDLEDVLAFARKYCGDIYDRISREVQPIKEDSK